VTKKAKHSLKILGWGSNGCVIQTLIGNCSANTDQCEPSVFFEPDTGCSSKLTNLIRSDKEI
jgi:hypothetical protein